MVYEIEPITFYELSKKWSQSEIIGYTYQYERELESAVNHLNSRFKNCQVVDIKPEDVSQFISERYKCNPNTGKKMSRALLSNIIDVGSRIFEFGIDNDYAYKNPFKNKKRLLPKNAPHKSREPINDIQKQYVLSTEHRAQTISIIMLFCGLRQGEALALEWDDIDLLNKKLAVTKSLERISSNRYEVTPHTKNGKDRYIPIPDKIVDFLRPKKEDSLFNFVCPKTDGKIQTLSSYDQMWNSYQNEINYRCYCDKQKKLNMPIKSKFSPTGIPQTIQRFTAHQLRHTYCTMLYFAGVDVLTASKLMGHSSVEITLRIYTHLDEKYKSYNISKFNNYIDKLPIAF